MKGDQFAHNFLLAERCLSILWDIGAVAFREYPTAARPNPPRVDIFALWNGYRLVLECENSARRADKDIAKAYDLRGDLLLFAVPTARVAMSIKRKIKKTLGHQAGTNLRIVVLALGAAQQLLRNKSLLMSLLNTSPDINTKIPGFGWKHSNHQPLRKEP